MSERLLFLTGRLAQERLTTTIDRVGLEPGSWRVASVGVKVAALMTEAILKNRLKPPLDADRVIVPGRTRMDLTSLAQHYGVPFERGPDELIDLPVYLGRNGTPPDFTQHALTIFAEIIEAPQLTVAEIVTRAKAYRAKGADVIDIGCQPGADFPHLDEVVRALRAHGHQVSVDSADPGELRRAVAAGATHLLSLDETNLDIVAGSTCIPVLVPKPHGDLASLIRAVDKATALGIPHMADAILDPINFGFTTSIERYAELRRARPDVPMLMGTGNLTELTEADSGGLTALLVGICTELAITNVLVVQVSPHTRNTIEEHDAARRLMYRAREDGSLPKGYGGAGLIGLHDLAPIPQSSAEIAAGAAAVRDDNFRIQVAEDGIHVYSRQGHQVVTDAFDAFPKLDVGSDGAHAFYLGYELAKAEIAHALGKRYVQDNPLDWGIAAPKPAVDPNQCAPESTTLTAKREAAALDRLVRTEAASGPRDEGAGAPTGAPEVTTP